MPKAQFVNFAPSAPVGFDPFASADAETIEQLLTAMCHAEDLSFEERSEFDDQVEALVPALIELREAGHQKLSSNAIADYGTLDGFMQLAADERLTPLSRARCLAMKNRIVVVALRAHLGR